MTQSELRWFARVRSQITNGRDAWLAARMFTWACWIPVLKRIVPLPTLVRLVHKSGTGARDATAEARIVTLARWSCRLTHYPAVGNCLERSLVAYRFLGKANAQPALAVGFKRDREGKVAGHVWVLVDGRPVGETDFSFSDEYETACVFGPDARSLTESRRLATSA